MREKFTGINFLLAALMISVLTVMSYFAYKSTKSSNDVIPTAAEQVLKDSPDLEPFTTVDGEPVALSTKEAAYTLVYSWASWCLVCGEELSMLNELALRNDVKVIAVNRAETKYIAQDYLATLSGVQNVQIVLDPSDRLFSSIEGFAMPEYVLYDNQGVELLKGRGSLDLKKVTEILGT